MWREIVPFHENAVKIEVGREIGEETRRNVLAVYEAVLKASRDGRLEEVTDIIPAYGSVAVFYRFSPDAPGIVQKIGRVLENAGVEQLVSVGTGLGRDIAIPVCYGGEFGPDLDDVAALHGLSPDEVVRLHASPVYLVHMMGFAPGFAYLGGLPEQIATPRLSDPRTEVLAGSVGIGGSQTGVYSLTSPGGWNIIGRTPLRMFDPHRDQPSLLRAGDRVRFEPVDEDTYFDLMIGVAERGRK